MGALKKAVQFSNTGHPPDVVEVIDAETPSVGAKEALIDVEVATINPAHLLTLQGSYGVKPALPSIPGAEGIGKIAALGQDVKNVGVGDRVMIPPYTGTWRQQVVVPADKIIIKFPDEGDPVQLSMLMANPPTAWLLLKSVVKLDPGDWLIQNAANSAVGQYVMQLARIYGYKTVNLVRRKGLEGLVASAGGTVCLVESPKLKEQVKSATSGAPIKLGLDAIAGEQTQILADCLSENAIIANYGMLSDSNCQLSPHDIIFRNLSLRGVWLSKWLRGHNSTPKSRIEVYQELTEYILDGRMCAEVEASYTLDQIKDAVTHAMRPGRSGKIILKPNG